MIRDHAPAIVDPEQAVELVTDLIGRQQFAFGKPKPVRQRAESLDGDLHAVYVAVLEDSTIDEISASVSLEPGRVASVLSELELEGLLIGEGGRWRRK